MKADHAVVVCTAVDSETTARAMARQLVELRLAACVQCTPVHSTYRWKGAIEEAAEFALTAKTLSSRAGDVVQFIRSHHPYELPEVIVLPIEDGLPPYLDWIAAETT